MCVAFQAEANREGGAYNAGPRFVNFVSAATPSAHVDCVRFVIVTGLEGGWEDGIEEQRSVLDRGLRLAFEVDWTDRDGCRVDEDEGFGFTADLVEAIERLIAAIAALLLADTSFVKSCVLMFALEVVVVTGFDGICVVAVLQV